MAYTMNLESRYFLDTFPAQWENGAQKKLEENDQGGGQKGPAILADGHCNLVDASSVYLSAFIETTCYGRYQSCKYNEQLA